MTDKASLSPRNLGARAVQDYAQWAAQEHRGTVRRILEDGARTNGEVAAELVRLRVPSASGGQWTDRAAGLLLRRLGIRREEWLERDLEAIRETVEDLWLSGIRARPQLAIALDRSGIPTRTGRPWSAASAGRLIQDLGLSWDDSNVRLRRGDTVPEVIEIPRVGEPEPIEAAVPVQVEQPAELPPQAAAPRRRALRV
ncbi:hypothetical protein [Methylobacterium aerolatum]|uniref:Recombinase domain-containing protein n=1 Tax=Methylobacterium aerolatum TaxID=418708 RepID=A0ABU0I5Y3_9HYPH|nr:hypothetical protein [Methylobacterium aerolatum]MDQ0450022.1 hypothetical protein [Methylobacterium aerolatum]